MSTSGKGGGKFSYSALTPEQLTQGVADVNLKSAEGGEWEKVYSRKSKNKGVGTAAAKPSVPLNTKAEPWEHKDVNSKMGMHSNASSGKASRSTFPTQSVDSRRMAGRGAPSPQQPKRGYAAAPAVVSTPLEGGWNWNSRGGASRLPVYEEGRTDGLEVDREENVEVDGDDDTECNEDDSADDLYSDGFDSDESEKSHETQKQNKWYKSFFELLDNLTVDEINEPSREWHCPACQGGPGAIDWYRGLKPLISHANKISAKRVKLHRDFAKLLSEELQRKGTSGVSAGEAFGKWEGLRSQMKDHEIVWPPMVVIMNTKLELDENEKWLGMGSQELLEYFSSYAALRAKHSYGPQGHRGMSLLIFEASAMGYLEAERLHKHFENQKTDRYAWDHHPVRFYPGGKRQLYGYMAQKGDLDNFNQHSQVKTRLKFEMRSYQEMVVSQMKQMSEDNQQLVMYKDKVARAERHSKAMEESFSRVTEKLRKTMEENRIVRLRTKMHHKQNKEEMDFQEQFFKDQLQIIHAARDKKEDEFEMLQREEREKVKQEFSNSSTLEEKSRRTEELAKFIKSQDQDIEDFVAEREELFKLHEEEVAAMIRRHREEQIEKEKKLDAKLEQLMEKYGQAH